MNCTEFNEKYKDYREEGHYGLDIGMPIIIDYLDKEFVKLIEEYGDEFRYSQIKLKFNTSRVYMSPREIDTYVIENHIDFLIKRDERNDKIDNILK